MKEHKKVKAESLKIQQGMAPNAMRREIKALEFHTVEYETFKFNPAEVNKKLVNTDSDQERDVVRYVFVGKKGSAAVSLRLMPSVVLDDVEKTVGELIDYDVEYKLDSTEGTIRSVEGAPDADGNKTYVVHIAGWTDKTFTKVA